MRHVEWEICHTSGLGAQQMVLLWSNSCPPYHNFPHNTNQEYLMCQPLKQGYTQDSLQQLPQIYLVPAAYRKHKGFNLWGNYFLFRIPSAFLAYICIERVGSSSCPMKIVKLSHTLIDKKKDKERKRKAPPTTNPITLIVIYDAFS